MEKKDVDHNLDSSIRTDNISDEVGTNPKEKLLARLKKQPVLNAGSWTRDELYDDDHNHDS